VCARPLGTLLTPVLALGLASTAVLGLRLDDPGASHAASAGVVGAAGMPAVAEAAVARGASGVHGVQTPLASASLRSRGGATGVIRPGHFSQVAVTWHGTAPSVRVSTHTAGRWTRWQAVEELDDLDLHVGDGTHGTQLLPVGPSDAVRVRVSGGHARDLEVVTIDPGRNGGSGDLALAAATTTDSTAPAPATTSAGASASDTTSATTAVSASPSPTPTTIYDALPAPAPYTPPSHYAPRPGIYGRAAWGADEALRKAPPQYNRTLQQMHVHHTVSRNDYTRAAVPALIRGMYWYHTQALGWNDIGYNFLIDRFGRIWEGRYGGDGNLVRGAHTLGFNYNSFGVSLIGNFERRYPSRYAVRALVRLAAWKLDYYRLRPAGVVTEVSQGSDLFPAGTTVTLPVIDGHRQTNQTACPGRYLFAKLPVIRTRAQTRADSY
jgi:uncharacterized protein with LGFP repeats